MNNHTLTDILNQALMDAYQARDTYRKILDTFGPVHPFSHIAEAKQRHIEMLIPLYERYAIPLPVDPYPQRPNITDSLPSACQLAVVEALTNIAMYDRLLAVTEQPDVLEVLQRLQAASRDHHLPALQRCAKPRGMRGSGQRFGRASDNLRPGRHRVRRMGQGCGRGGRGCKTNAQRILDLNQKFPTLIVQNFLRQSEHYLFNHTGAI